MTFRGVPEQVLHNPSFRAIIVTSKLSDTKWPGTWDKDGLSSCLRFRSRRAIGGIIGLLVPADAGFLGEVAAALSAWFG